MTAVDPKCSDNIDGALQYGNGYTYFFKRGLYYRFDDMKFKVRAIVNCNYLFST